MDAAESILDGSRLRETLELLVVAEENHNLWQLLRLAHVRQTERSHLAAAIEDARAAVAHDDVADQALVATIGSVLFALMESSGTEGFAVLNAPRLRARTDELSDALEWFADQRLLERDTVAAIAWPGFKDSTQHVVRTAVTGAGALAGAARDAARRRPTDPTGSLEPTKSPELDQPGPVATDDTA